MYQNNDEFLDSKLSNVNNITIQYQFRYFGYTAFFWKQQYQFRSFDLQYKLIQDQHNQTITKSLYQTLLDITTLLPLT